MAILDRPLFRRPLTKDELRMYGLPAFANGGVVHLKKGGDPLGLFNPGGYAQEKMKEEEEAKTALTDLVPSMTTEQLQSGGKLPETLKTEEKKEMPDGPDIKLKKKPSKEEIEAIREQIEGSGETEVDKLKKRFLEKSKLYKEILGDSEKMRKEQGFLQLAQFGLNLASAQGANFLDKVAKSAKDPLNAFAELGRKAFEDERAVELLALEATEGEIEKEKQAEIDKELAAIKAAGEADDSDLSVFQDVFGAADGKVAYLNFLQGRYGETREDQILKLTNTLLANPEYQGEGGQEKAAKDAEGVVDKIYQNQQSPEDTGGGDEVKPPLTEEVIEETMKANEGSSREEIIEFLGTVGYDNSAFKEA